VIIQNIDPYREPSFSLANRLTRALWNGVWLVAFRASPRPLYAWRAILLRLFGARLGQEVNCRPSVKIWAPWNLTIGDFVGIGDDVILYSMDKITIDDYAVISQGAHLCTGSHDIHSPNFQLITAPIRVGSRVWLCAECFIGAGVAIAEGSVIGARGVVMKSIDEPWAVWAGVPIKWIANRDKAKAMK
jgi:putative colanic acid biosynthesis acetyltransferase WcaF